VSLSANPLLELHRLGQRLWLDGVGRELIATGSLARHIREERLAGAIVSPALGVERMPVDPEAGEGLAACEVARLDAAREAADLLAEIYGASGGADGFVGLTLAPYLAHDPVATLTQAQRLWARIERPNAMIQIPATPAGLTAMRACIAAGINVNVTWLFSAVRYRAAVDAYAAGLEARASAGRPLAAIAGVASFCVAPIDAQVDRVLDGLAAHGQPAARALRGKSAIASACRIYEIYEDFLASPRWQDLARQGARPQRLAWVGTASDDPGASPVKYVEALIVPDTISTLALETLGVYRRLGRPQLRLERHIAGACDQREGLERLGVDLEAVAEQLELSCLAQQLAPFERLATSLGEPH